MTPTSSDLSEVLNSRLFELSVDLICVAEGGYFLFINPAFERVLGYSQKELLAKPFLYFVHPDDVEATFEVERQLADGQPVNYFENRYRCKDGKYKWLAWTAISDPKLGVTYGVARDMTLAKASGERFRKSERLQERAEKLAKMGHWYWNTQANELFWSSGTFELFGLSEGRFKPSFEGFIERVCPEDREMVTSSIEKTLYEDKPYDIEFRIIREDGEVIFTRARGTVIREDSQKPIQMMGTIQNIDENKRLELQLRQSQKMEALGTLAGGIAHDFNNILAIIRGFSEKIKSSIGNASETSIRQSISHILEAQERGRSLISQILTFSRYEPGRREPLVLASVVESAIETLKATTPSHIEIQCDLDDGGLRVMTDPTQIHQMIFNICSNSCQAMEEKGGIIKVSLKEGCIDGCQNAKSPPSVMLTIKDNGPGIPNEYQDKVFNPFFTTKGIGEGTGLGLSLVHSIVKSQGGSISLVSENGEGTEISICFPATDKVVQGDTSVKNQRVKIRGHGRVLVVEDEPLLAELYSMNLEDMGYQVTVFNNGLNASERFKEDPDAYDLLITDHAMPFVTGKQLISLVQSIRPNLPVILASGYSDLINVSFKDDVGVRKFLSKPFAVEDLRAAVEECLGESNS